MTSSAVQVGAVGDYVGTNPSLAGIPASWSCLVRAGVVLATPAGKPLVHSQRPLIEAVAQEAKGARGLQLDSLTLYSMLCTLRDSVEKDRQDQGRTCRYLLLGELSLRTCAGPEAADQLALLRPLEEYFERNDLPRLQLGQAGDGQHQEENLRAFGLGTEVDRLVSFFDERLRGLTPAQHCVVTNCVHLHSVFVLGILLAESACTPEQYADGLMAVNCWIPGVFGGITKRDVLRTKAQVRKEVHLMLRFRDLADAVTGANAGGVGRTPQQSRSKRTKGQRTRRAE